MMAALEGISISSPSHCITSRLMAEVKRHGSRVVMQNRYGRAAILEENGHHEEAECLEREGDIALELVAKGV
jgi:hypothetical protein